VYLPLWLGAIIAGLLVVVCALTLVRGNDDTRTGPMIRVALVLVLALAAGWTLDYFSRRDLAAERQALDARTHELAMRALLPGSALACLDGIAGAAVEEPCEKAIFASPEATAAAVTYVATRLALLASASDHARRTGNDYGEVIGPLRRAAEADRFGIVAHVLAVRDDCTPHQCAALALLHDSSRVTANLTQRLFETQVRSHMAAWPGAAGRPGASDPVAAGSPAVPSVAGAKPANDLYFPSSSSIPPVNIMTAEPSAPRQQPSETTTDPAATPRKPTPSGPARAPASQKNSEPARSAPLQLSPGQ
jgi:hypothetical protein